MVEGVRILGTTLWSSIPASSKEDVEMSMSDFRVIKMSEEKGSNLTVEGILHPIYILGQVGYMYLYTAKDIDDRRYRYEIQNICIWICSCLSLSLPNIVCI